MLLIQQVLIKICLRAREVFGLFEKQAPDPLVTSCSKTFFFRQTAKQSVFLNLKIGFARRKAPATQNCAFPTYAQIRALFQCIFFSKVGTETHMMNNLSE